MRRPSGLALFLLTILLGACSDDRKVVQPAPEGLAGAWLAHGLEGRPANELLEQRLDHLKTQGYGWIALAPEPSMPEVTQPRIDLDPNDVETRRTIRAARALGFEVLLFPRIESASFFRAEDPLWRGDIAMNSKLEWVLFHDQLEAMLVHYAKLAAEEGASMFSLGLEYRQSTRDFPARWRRIIAAVREVYTGPITYSANWYEEFREIEFWDAVDHIGVGAYFPLATGPGAPRAEMRAAWQPIRHELAALSRRFDRPILFTELGYPGVDQAGWKPWEWTTREGKTIDHAHQADCFRAFFDTFAAAEFVSGMFVWRYEADPRRTRDWDYSPEGRPAEEVIRRQLRR